MYAVVDVKDKQFKVREDDTLYVPYHSEADVDDTLTLDRVLLVSDGEGDVTLGTPSVDDASVTAQVVDQVKGDKVIVFKKKRRKRYRVKRGHRQQYTQIRITSLDVNGTPADDEVEEAADEVDESSAPSDTATEAPASDADEATDAEADAEVDDDGEEDVEATSDETDGQTNADDETDDEK